MVVLDDDVVKLRVTEKSCDGEDLVQARQRLSMLVELNFDHITVIGWI